MSKEVSLFGGDNPLANNEMFKELQRLNDTLGGNSYGTTRRISFKGGKFREMVNGEQIKVSKSDTMNIIIIDAAPIARTYYEGTYDPDNIVAPVCWSKDTEAPDSDATSPQATRCGDCPQNVKGSGQGQTRACRYSQRLAVTVEGNLNTVYQMQLAATSIFGDSEENKMPMQAYARFLKAHDMPPIGVVTEMRFDENAEMPKLFFKAVRPITEEEFKASVALRDHEDTKAAITFKVFETDKVAKEPKPANDNVKKLTKVKAVPEPEDDTPVEEPTKVESKNPDPVVEEDDNKLANLVSGWDD